MSYLLNLISGMFGGASYALVGYLSNSKKEQFDFPKFIATIAIGALNGVLTTLGGAVMNIPVSPEVLLPASAGVAAIVTKGMKIVASPSTPVSVPENSFDAKIKAREGSATKTISMWDGNPCQTLYIVATGKTYIASRKAETPEEAEVARQSNIARQYSDGLMSEDQVKQAGYDAEKLLLQFKFIWQDQAEELERLKKE